MKKVLVLGAAGNLGIETIKYLLSEGKYEITALDLHNKRAFNILKKYRKRINIIYGDINDRVLIDNLVTEHDYIYFLAGIIPPLCDIEKNMGQLIEYNGLKNICRAIKAYNPECSLIYSSSTSIYGIQNKPVSIKTKINHDKYDFYNETKINCEQLIKKELKNYVILRLPLLLGNFNNDFPIYNIKAVDKFEVITTNDCAYGLVKVIDKYDLVNKKIFNMTSGLNNVLTIKEYYYNVLTTYGLNLRYIMARLFLPKNYYLNVTSDSDQLEEILHFRSESIKSYVIRLKRTKMYKKRYFARILAKPFLPKIRKEEK